MLLTEVMISSIPHLIPNERAETKGPSFFPFSSSPYGNRRLAAAVYFGECFPLPHIHAYDDFGEKRKPAAFYSTIHTYHRRKEG